MFLVACVGRIMDAANTRKKEALGASVSATSNLTPKFLGHTHRKTSDCIPCPDEVTWMEIQV
ncbi:MAG: hypothetical protein GXP37_07070 [Chloroflexi bacterium]|nr:hypothetical protein [Chloroflexota bacterium]